jgi:hypothetical protein
MIDEMVEMAIKQGHGERSYISKDGVEGFRVKPFLNHMASLVH